MKIKVWIVVLLLLLPIVVSIPNAQAQDKVSVKLYAPKVSLPADGGEHEVLAIQIKKGEKPLVVSKDVEVELSSTNEDVIIVPKRVVIKAGSSYTMVKVTTTKTQGKATIIAHVKGYGEASIEISTVEVKPKPASIVVYAIPPTLRASPDSKSNIVVQLIDKFGRPAVTDRAVAVSFELLKEELGSIVKSKIIERGKNKVEAEFTASYIPGEAIIIVRAEGIGSDSITIRTFGVVGKILKVYVAPSNIPADGKSRGLVVVQLQDEKGNPAPAPKDIEVVLTSSNLSVAKVSDKLKIKQGQDYAIGWYEVTKDPGKTTITASAIDYSSGSEELITTKEGKDPISLVMQIVPNISVGEGIKGFAVVQVQDKEGLPCDVNKEVEVFVCSSNSNVANICSSVLIEKGSSYAIAKFSAITPGNTTMTASAQGLITVRKPVRVFGPKLSKIGLFGPTKVLGSEKEFGPFMIALLDENEVPTKAGESIEVNLESSNTSIISVNKYLVIPKGKEYVEFNVKLAGLEGSVSITANSKLGSSQLQISVSSRKPDKIFVQVIPDSFIANGQEYSSLFIELLDSLGFPIEALDDTPIYLASSNFSVVEVEKQLVIERYGTVKIGKVKVGNVSGNASIIADSPSLLPSEANLHTFTLPMSGELVSKPQKIKLNMELNVTLKLMYDNKPIADAEIEWIAENCKILKFQNTTNENGYATIVILGNKVGNATITAKVQKSGYDSLTLKSNITILPLPLDISISILKQPVFANQSVMIKVVVESDGKPVNGATVKLSASAGKILPPTSKTNANGEVLAEFISSKIGNIEITATASKEDYEAKSSSIQFSVIRGIQGVEEGGSIEQGIIGWIMENLVLVVAGIALPIGVIVGIIIIRRRRQAS